MRNTLVIQRERKICGDSIGENHITQFPPLERTLGVKAKKAKKAEKKESQTQETRKKNTSITTMVATKLNHRIMLLEHFRSTKFVYF